MADTLQYGSISGNASVRQRISGEVVIAGKVMKELRFLPYSEFPEIGREETLYIDTDNNAMYYYDGSAYAALSGGGGGGTDNYNALSNKPSVNSVTLIGNKTSSELGLQELISDLSAIRSGATSGSTAVQPETLETALSEKQDAINDLDDIRSGAFAGVTAVQPSDMETALADKQDVISDLSSIRSGAASGATAVQPDDMETALSSKQDVISDLSDIRSGASAGATAVQPSDMESALSEKQDTISDLQTIRSGASAGATAVQPSDLETALADKQDVISDLDAIRSGATAGNTALQPEDIDTLPTDGSSNPVSSGGTYNFVNSSIATNTAYFIGTFASVEELEAYTGTVTNNDYAFVTSTDSAGNTLYNRYKYNAATQTWGFEYAVNNTAFTTAQWAAIQSGMTASDKTKLDGIETGANKTVIDASPTSESDNAVSSGGVHTALSGKQDTISDLSNIRSGASAGATAVQPSALSDYQTKLSGTNKLDPSYIDYDASHRAVSDTEKSTWNGKQSALTTEQLAAVNSGINSADVAQIETNENNILSAYGGIVGKNVAKENDFTATLNKTVYCNPITGMVHISAANVSSTDTDSTICRILLYYTDGTVSSNNLSLSRGSNISLDINIGAKIIERIVIYASDNYNHSTGDTVTVSDLMICTQADYAADPTYQPYVRTNAELTVAEDEDRAALAEVIDGGAAGTKNHCTQASGSNNPSSDRWINIPVSDVGVGQWVMSFGTLTSTDTDDTLCQAICFNSSSQQVSNWVNFKREANTNKVFTTTDNVAYVRLYAANSYAASEGDTVTFTDAMLSQKGLYDADPSYVPYAPALTNIILTPAAIKAVDEGAKNRLTVNTKVETGQWTNIPVVLQAGSYVLAIGTLSSTDTDATTCQIGLFNSENQNLLGRYPQLNRGNNIFYNFEINSESAYLRIYSSDSTAHGTGDTVTINDAMICTAADWAVSQKFVPYAPTNRELYEMIQALQNNS